MIFLLHGYDTDSSRICSERPGGVLEVAVSRGFGGADGNKCAISEVGGGPHPALRATFSRRREKDSVGRNRKIGRIARPAEVARIDSDDAH
ncbi:hypothetical protein LC55x_1918 [Lysobacter capsici]|nr:hypothetical protein LC55x_1918 [Lysobacter capsici]